MISSKMQAVLAAAVASVLVIEPAIAQNNPIPGIDVVVKKKPSGTALHVITDKGGRFVVRGLAAGAYTISLQPASSTMNEMWSNTDSAGPAKAPISTSRSNTKHSSLQIAQMANRSGVNVLVAMARDNTAEIPMTTMEINIPRSGMNLTGTIVTSDTPEDAAKFLRIEGHIGK